MQTGAGSTPSSSFTPRWTLRRRCDSSVVVSSSTDTPPRWRTAWRPTSPILTLGMGSIQSWGDGQLDALRPQSPFPNLSHSAWGRCGVVACVQFSSNSSEGFPLQVWLHCHTWRSIINSEKNKPYRKLNASWELSRYPEITLTMNRPVVSRYVDALKVRYWYRVVPRYFDIDAIWPSSSTGVFNMGVATTFQGVASNYMWYRILIFAFAW